MSREVELIVDITFSLKVITNLKAASETPRSRAKFSSDS